MPDRTPYLFFLSRRKFKPMASIQRCRVIPRVAAACLLPLLVLLSSASFASTIYVKYQADLRVHFQSHLQRVVRLALHLLKSKPDHFPGVSESLALELLTLHDAAKLDHSPSFRQRFWGETVKSDQSFMQRLFHIYGKGYEYVAENREARATIDQLNATDRQVSQEFFRSKGLLTPDGSPTPVAQALLRLERIADVVDRNLDPVALEEFGLTERRLISDFLKNPEDLELSRPIAEGYAELVRGARFVDAARKSLPPCRYKELQSDLGFRGVPVP